MKVTINGVTYEGTVEEIREVVGDPACGRDTIKIRLVPPYSELWPDLNSTQRNWDGSPRVTC